MRRLFAIVLGLVGALACVEGKQGGPTAPDVEAELESQSQAVAGEPDAEGPGWRMHGDLLENVHEGVRMQVLPGWRLEPQSKLGEPRAFRGFGLIHDQHGVELVIRRVSDVDVSEDELRRRHSESYLKLANEDAPAMVAELDGEQLQLTARSGESYEYLHAMTFRAGQPLEILLRYPAKANRELLRELARSALATVELLTPEERAALRVELEHRPIRRDVLADGRSLRGATFHDYAFGVRVNIPSSLIEGWMDIEHDGADVSTRLVFEDRGRDLHAALLAAELPHDMRFSAQEWHERAIAEISAASDVVPRSSMKAQRFGDAEGLIATLDNDRHGLQVRLATVVDDHRALVFLVRKGTRTVDAAGDGVDAMLAAFEVVDGLERARMDGDRYIDAQGGYAIEGLLATGVETHFYESARRFQTMTVWTNEDSAIAVMVHNFAPDAGSMQNHLRAKIAEIDALDPMIGGRWISLFEPVQGRRLTWEQAGTEHTFALFLRDRTIYELHMQSSVAGSFEQVLAGFQLLD